MNLFRVRDNKCNKYAEGFHLSWEGVLGRVGHLPLSSGGEPLCTYRDEFEEGRYTVEFSNGEFFENDLVVWKCKGSLIEGKVLMDSNKEFWVTDLKGGNRTRLHKCTALVVIGTVHDKLSNNE